MGKMAFCKFCGQIVDVEVPQGASEELFEEIGTENCSCYEAEKLRKKKKQVAKAKIEINALLNGEDKTRGIKPADKRVIELLNQAADLMGGGLIHKISVNITGGRHRQHSNWYQWKDISPTSCAV